MPRYKGRIVGTIDDDFDVVAEDEGQARDQALMEWRYVEYADLDVASIEEVDDAE